MFNSQVDFFLMTIILANFLVDCRYARYNYDEDEDENKNGNENENGRESGITIDDICRAVIKVTDDPSSINRMMQCTHVTEYLQLVKLVSECANSYKAPNLTPNSTPNGRSGEKIDQWCRKDSYSNELYQPERSGRLETLQRQLINRLLKKDTKSLRKMFLSFAVDTCFNGAQIKQLSDTISFESEGADVWSCVLNIVDQK